MPKGRRRSRRCLRREWDIRALAITAQAHDVDGIMALGGVILIMNGLLAEMVSRTYHESQDKPIYVIREIRDAEPARPREVVGA